MKERQASIAINGFGRIGSLLPRQLEGSNLHVVAINSQFSGINDTPEACSQAAKLLRFNNPYGRWEGRQIEFTDDSVFVNGSEIKVGRGSSLETITWSGATPEGIYEATGAFKSWGKISPLLEREGVRWVILACPPKNLPNQPSIPSFVIGANEELLKGIDFTKPQIVSAASCTTMALAPLARIVDESFGINRAHIVTVHAVTDKQRLLMGTGRDSRLMAPAMDNIIIYQTGASEAIGSIFPHLAPRFKSAKTYRVPTYTGSVLQLNIQVERPISKRRLVKTLIERAETTHKGIVRVLLKGSVDDVSASGFCIKDLHSALVLESQIDVEDDWATIVAYYDNEWAYCARLAEFGKKISGLI